MAPAKVILVLAVCATALGQYMHSMEARHRSLGNRPPPFTYFAPQQRIPSYAAPRPTYVVPPQHHVRPSYSPPAYQIPYPAPQPQPTYSAPRPQPTYSAPRPQPIYPAPRPVPTYPAPRPQPTYPAPRPQPTYPAPRPQPTYPAPLPPKQTYSVPAVPAWQPTYAAPVALTYSPAISNFPTTPIYGKPPTTPSVSYPPATPKPYIAATTPKTGPSLLDLPWVKPIYTRYPSAPSSYSWNVPDVRTAAAPPISEASEEDVGVSISSVNTPVSAPVASQDFEVRAIPQETVVAPVPVVLPTAPPLIVRDDSVEAIEISVQRVVPLPTATQVQNVQPVQIVQSAPAPAQPPVSPVVPVQQVQRIPSAPVPAQPPVSPVVPVQQVQRIPSAPAPTQPPFSPILIRDDSIEDIQIVQQVSILPSTTVTPANAFIIRDDSIEDIPVIQQVPAPLAAAPVVNPVVIRDDSIEDIQIVQRVQPVSIATPLPAAIPTPLPVATQTPQNVVVIQDDSIENGRILPQNVVVIQDPIDSIENDQIVLNLPATPNLVAPQPTQPTTGGISLVTLDNSDEDLVFRDVPLAVQPVPATFSVPATAPVTPSTLFVDSLEDIRILETPGTAPLVTVARDSLEVRPDVSNEDIELRIISQGVTATALPGQLPTTTARVVLLDSVEDTQPTSGVLLPNVQLSPQLTADVLVVDSSENVQPNVLLPGPLAGNPTQPGVVLVDSVEDIQPAQQLSLSNVSPSEPATTARVILVQSAEDIQDPISQSANVALNQESREVPDRSDEQTVTISQVNIAAPL